jgi:predicted phosphodiesterase
VLSDIHGNLEALTAVLEALTKERIDRYLCLGDSIGYGADPAACLSRLQELDAVMVAGNHEGGALGKLDVGWFNDAARAAIVWTREQLGFVELDFLRRLPLTATEGLFTLAHGTLRQPARFEYLMDLAQVVDTLKVCHTLFCLVGHTHLPAVVEYDRTTQRVSRVLTHPQELASAAFSDQPDRFRYLVNPGSVGQPRDGNPHASYAVIDMERKQVAIHRIAYAVEDAARKIRDAGLPSFLADRLLVGR